MKAENSPDRSSSATAQNIQENVVVASAEVVASSTSSSPSSHVESATTIALPTAVISSMPRHARMITTQGHIRSVLMLKFLKFD